jgi:hypothetical protein
MGKSALIGYTGFVGSNLDQSRFSDFYNSSNFREMAGQEFDLVVCAGLQAKKWWANQHPVEDWEGISRLADVLSTIRAKQFVLISTVDVFAVPIQVDEHSPAGTPGVSVYGLNRLRFEDWVRKTFPSFCVIRLSGLFGKGLKKNVIFDLLTRNNLASLYLEDFFQYYDLKWLDEDMDRVLVEQLDLVHLTVPPVRTGEIVRRFFPSLEGELSSRGEAMPMLYDFRSLYWGRWPEGTLPTNPVGIPSFSGYQHGEEAVWEGMAQLVEGWAE